MGYINYQYLLTKDIDHKIFIETGTFKGEQIKHLLRDGSYKFFDKIYTIELGEQNCRIASKRFELYEKYDCDESKFDQHTDEEDATFNNRKEFFDGKIVLIQGDSAVVLKELLATEINEPVVFWLDAHSGKEKYAKGDVDVPLLNELAVISSHNVKDHAIFIDDIDKFGIVEPLCDWSGLTMDMVTEKLSVMGFNSIGVEAPFGMPILYAYLDNKPFSIDFLPDNMGSIY